MTIDTTGTIEIRASPTRMILITLGAAAFTMVSFKMARDLASSGSFAEFIGWVGTLFFGAATLTIIWRAIRTLAMRRPVLVLSPDGFQYDRISSEFIPWTAVEKIYVWQHRQNRTIVVKVPETVWLSLPVGTFVRWSRFANRSLGVDGLWITTLELQTEFDDLFRMVKAYAAAHGGRAG
jgi:hypothetical protein